MEQLGIMLYGYNKTDAHLIKDTLDSVFNSNLEMLSGSLKESHKIDDIISDEEYDIYEDNETKIMMFLGFNDNLINVTLEKFPGADKVTRPIFCVLTENNMSWPLNQLIEHLIEEKEAWKKKDKEKS